MSFSQLCAGQATRVASFIFPLSKHLFLQITPVVLQRLAKLLNDDDVPPGARLLVAARVTVSSVLERYIHFYTSFAHCPNLSHSYAKWTQSEVFGMCQCVRFF